MSASASGFGGVELVVTDLAGTVFSDDGVIVAAFEAAFSRLGFQSGPVSPRAAALASMGRSKLAVLEELLADSALARRANSLFEQAYAEQLTQQPPQEIPGARAVIGRLRAAGVRVAATTGFASSTRDLVLDRLGWRDLFDLALSPSGTIRGRPYPDLVLAAALKLRAGDMRRVLVIGDTTNDLWAGTRAGAGHVVGVLTGAHGRAELTTAPHTAIIGSFADLEQGIDQSPGTGEPPAGGSTAGQPGS